MSMFLNRMLLFINFIIIKYQQITLYINIINVKIKYKIALTLYHY